MSLGTKYKHEKVKREIAILALQGAFAEHQQMLQRLGVESVLIRNLADWQQYMDSEESASAASEHKKSAWEHKGLILPGGESTAMMKIMRDEGLIQPVTDAINSGLPVFGTCAGMILLDDTHLGCMDITVRRNAYGRQLGSFYAEHDFKGIGTVPMTFIRAPYIERCGDGVEVLSVLDGNIIAARQRNMLVCSFHPELNDDTRIHQMFLSCIGNL